MRNEKLRFDTRKKRLRYKLSLFSNRPRLSVFRSNKHIYAQVIDDSSGVTLVSASTAEKNFKIVGKSNCNSQQAKIIGELIGKRALQAGVDRVVFDKGGYKYHGRVKVLADAAREHINF